MVKLTRKREYQCSAIIQPGEYTIDIWDGKQCLEKSPLHLITCPDCGKAFCLMTHWHKHDCHDQDTCEHVMEFSHNDPETGQAVLVCSRGCGHEERYLP